MPKGSSDERESSLQSGWTVESQASKSKSVAQPKPVTEIAPADAADDAVVVNGGDGSGTRTNQVSNLVVVILGVTGGIFLLYAWVWLSWAKYYAGANAVIAATSGTVGGVLQQVVYWMAPLAPLLWFIAAIALHRRSPRKLTVALVIGLIVTLPFPMIFASGAAL